MIISSASTLKRSKSFLRKLNFCFALKKNLLHPHLGELYFISLYDSRFFTSPFCDHDYLPPCHPNQGRRISDDFLFILWGISLTFGDGNCHLLNQMKIKDDFYLIMNLSLLFCRPWWRKSIRRSFCEW